MKIKFDLKTKAQVAFFLCLILVISIFILYISGIIVSPEDIEQHRKPEIVDSPFFGLVIIILLMALCIFLFMSALLTIEDSIKEKSIEIDMTEVRKEELQQEVRELFEEFMQTKFGEQ